MEEKQVKCDGWCKWPRSTLHTTCLRKIQAEILVIILKRHLQWAVLLPLKPWWPKRWDFQRNSATKKNLQPKKNLQRKTNLQPKKICNQSHFVGANCMVSSMNRIILNRQFDRKLAGNEPVGEHIVVAQ